MLRDAPSEGDDEQWEWAGLRRPLSDEQLRTIEGSLGIDTTVGAAR
jgi:hypothetical protein